MSGMKQLIMDCVRQGLAGLRLAYRATLTARAEGSGSQLAQGDALAGEAMQAAEVFQQFGFASGLPAGTGLIVLPVGGRSAHSVVIATEHGAYRVAVGDGEACVYSQWGDKVHVKKDRVEIKTKTLLVQADDQVIFETPNISMQGTGGGAATANMTGSLHITGGITSDADIVAGGISHEHHKHPGDSGGTTGEPE